MYAFIFSIFSTILQSISKTLGVAFSLTILTFLLTIVPMLVAFGPRVVRVVALSMLVLLFDGGVVGALVEGGGTLLNVL